MLGKKKKKLPGKFCSFTPLQMIIVDIHKSFLMTYMGLFIYYCAEKAGYQWISKSSICGSKPVIAGPFCHNLSIQFALCEDIKLLWHMCEFRQYACVFKQHPLYMCATRGSCSSSWWSFFPLSIPALLTCLTQLWDGERVRVNEYKRMEERVWKMGKVKGR